MTDRQRAVLRGLDARRTLGRWIVAFSSELECASRLTSLRDAGFAFLFEPAGWPPSAVWLDLRARNLVRGGYAEITWVAAHEPPVLVMRS